MGNAINILWNWLREFIPALKTECLIVGFGLIAMSICLMDVAITSGLSGNLFYAALHPGTTVSGLLAGIALVAAALMMKPVPRDQM